MKIFILIILQVLDSSGQQWSFSFPSRMVALIGSCVEIPCRFAKPSNYASYNIVWYRYERSNDTVIFKSNGISETIASYRGRTSLVRKDKNKCSLRINNVTLEDSAQFYPGIDAKMNAYKLQNKVIELQTTAVPNELDILEPGDMTEGKPVNITCLVEHTCISDPPRLWWNKPGLYNNTYHTELKDGVWKTKIVQMYIPSYQDHGTFLQCTVAHPNGQIMEKTVLLQIEYAAKGVTIIPGKNKFSKGDTMELICDFLACNPEPSHYTWYLNSSLLMYKTEKILIMHDITSELSGNYTCAVHNEIGISLSSHSVIITDNDTESNPESKSTSYTLNPTITIVPGIICLLLFLLIGFLCWRYRKFRKVLFCMANQAEDAKPSDAIYADLQRENICPEYDELKLHKEKIHPHIPVEENIYESAH
ncbi:B-cell receptor CD22-like [Pelobates fuscus]|uniref:B-cell receptor CD22-like n=1 Tax=Pelobates fuscus TaxID=191477 RepID=UPI002FE449DB